MLSCLHTRAGIRRERVTEASAAVRRIVFGFGGPMLQPHGARASLCGESLCPGPSSGRAGRPWASKIKQVAAVSLQAHARLRSVAALLTSYYLRPTPVLGHRSLRQEHVVTHPEPFKPAFASQDYTNMIQLDDLSSEALLPRSLALDRGCIPRTRQNRGFLGASCGADDAFLRRRLALTSSSVRCCVSLLG